MARFHWLALSSDASQTRGWAFKQGDADEISAGLLVAALEDFAAPPNGIYAVFPQRKHLPLRVRLWIDFLKQRYGAPEFWRAA